MVIYWKIFKQSSPTSDQRAIEKFEKEFGPLRHHIEKEKKQSASRIPTRQAQEMDDFD